MTKNVFKIGSLFSDTRGEICATMFIIILKNSLKKYAKIEVNQEPLPSMWPLC